MSLEIHGSNAQRGVWRAGGEARSAAVDGGAQGSSASWHPDAASETAANSGQAARIVLIGRCSLRDDSADPASRSDELTLDQPFVEALFSHQCRVGPGLHDAATLEDDDAIGAD